MRRGAALILAVGFLVLTCTAAQASSWERIFATLGVSNEIVEGQLENPKIYNAQARYTITNGDGFTGNFDGADTVNITLSGAGRTLHFDGTKDDLVAFADAHASEIWSMLFGFSPGAAVTGTTEGQFSSASVVESLVPPAIPSLLTRKWASDVLASGEYNFLKVGGVDVSGTSGIFTYGHTVFGPANQLGFAMPYRMLSAKDPLNTDIDAFQPTIYYKRDIYTGQPIFLTTGVAGFFGVNHVNSDLFEDGYYFRYGGNIFTTVGREIFPWLAVFGDFSYEVGKYWCPEGSVDEDIRFVAKALNELPVDNTFTFGARLGFVAIPDRLWGTLQCFRINSLTPPDGVQNDVQTVAMIKLGTQVLNFIYFDVGYKTTFEVPQYNDNTVILNVRAVW
jgi:hypothetical protein